MYIFSNSRFINLNNEENIIGFPILSLYNIKHEKLCKLSKHMGEYLITFMNLQLFKLIIEYISIVFMRPKSFKGITNLLLLQTSLA